MTKKVIAVGNTLMMDDGVGIFVAEKIKKELGNRDMNIIIGETNIDYCFSKLNNEDEFYIVDSSCFGNKPGTVTIKTIEEVKRSKNQDSTNHSLGLIELMKINQLNVKGYFIGIEIDSIDINFGLSDVLLEKLEYISTEVLNIIIKEKAKVL